MNEAVAAGEEIYLMQPPMSLGEIAAPFLEQFLRLLILFFSHIDSDVCMYDQR